MDTNRHKFKNGLIVGTILGGITTFFAMSKQTKPLRKRLSTDFDDLYDQVRDKFNELSNATEEAYDRLVETIVSEYADKRALSIVLKNRLIRELRSAWNDMQIYYLFSKVKSRFDELPEKSRDSFEELVDDVVAKFTKANEVTREKARALTRKIKEKWAELEEELGENVNKLL